MAVAAASAHRLESRCTGLQSITVPSPPCLPVPVEVSNRRCATSCIARGPWPRLRAADKDELVHAAGHQRLASVSKPRHDLHQVRRRAHRRQRRSDDTAVVARRPGRVLGYLRTPPPLVFGKIVGFQWRLIYGARKRPVLELLTCSLYMTEWCACSQCIGVTCMDLCSRTSYTCVSVAVVIAC